MILTLDLDTLYLARIYMISIFLPKLLIGQASDSWGSASDVTSPVNPYPR